MKILCALFLLLTVKAFPQETENQVYFNLSYFGILGTHPGLKVGIQYPLATFNSQETVDRLNQVIGSANFLFYFHRRNQLAGGLTVELGFRNRTAGGLNKEISLGAGYLRTFLPNRLHDFDQKAEPAVRRFRGAGHFLKLGSVGLGGNRGAGLDSDFWTIKPTLFHIRPFNTGGTLNFALDAGFQLRP